MDELKALAKTVAQNPDDDTTWLVYADKLREEGHERRADRVQWYVGLRGAMRAAPETPVPGSNSIQSFFDKIKPHWARRLAAVHAARELSPPGAHPFLATGLHAAERHALGLAGDAALNKVHTAAWMEALNEPVGTAAHDQVWAVRHMTSPGESPSALGSAVWSLADNGDEAHTNHLANYVLPNKALAAIKYARKNPPPGTEKVKLARTEAYDQHERAVAGGMHNDATHFLSLADHAEEEGEPSAFLREHAAHVQGGHPLLGFHAGPHRAARDEALRRWYAEVVTPSNNFSVHALRPNLVRPHWWQSEPAPDRLPPVVATKYIKTAAGGRFPLHVAVTPDNAESLKAEMGGEGEAIDRALRATAAYAAGPRRLSRPKSRPRDSVSLLFRAVRQNPYDADARRALADALRDAGDHSIRPRVIGEGSTPNAILDYPQGWGAEPIPAFTGADGTPRVLYGQWNPDALSTGPLHAKENERERWELWHTAPAGANVHDGLAIKYRFKHPGRSNTIPGTRLRKERHLELVLPVSADEAREVFPEYKPTEVVKMARVQKRAQAGGEISGGLFQKGGQFLGAAYKRIRDVAKKFKLARKRTASTRDVPTAFGNVTDARFDFLPAGYDPQALSRTLTLGELGRIEKAYGIPPSRSIAVKKIKAGAKPTDRLSLPLKSITALVDRLSRQSITGHPLADVLADPKNTSEDKVEYLTRHLIQQYKDYHKRHGGATDWYGAPVKELDDTLYRLFGPSEDAEHPAHPLWAPGGHADPARNAPANVLFKALIAATSSNSNPRSNVLHAYRVWRSGQRRGLDPILSAPPFNEDALKEWKDKAGHPPENLTGDKENPHALGKWWHDNVFRKGLHRVTPGYKGFPAKVYANARNRNDPRNGLVFKVGDKTIAPTLGINPKHLREATLPLAVNGALIPKGWTSRGQGVAINLKRLKALVRLGYQRYDETAAALASAGRAVKTDPHNRQVAAYRFASHFLLTPHDRESWDAVRDATGGAIPEYGKTKTNTSLARHEKMEGSYMFGPKFGPFFLNMHGRLDPLTADKWWTRWWTLPQGKTRESPSGKAERLAMRAAATRASERLGVKPAEFQADLWDDAQRAYRSLGGKGMESYTLADGARAMEAAHAGKVKLARKKGPPEELKPAIKASIQANGLSAVANKPQWSAEYTWGNPWHSGLRHAGAAKNHRAEVSYLEYYRDTNQLSDRGKEVVNKWILKHRRAALAHQIAAHMWRGETDHAGFKQSFLDNPDERTGHLAYADYLEERGDHWEDAAKHRAMGTGETPIQLARPAAAPDPYEWAKAAQQAALEATRATVSLGKYRPAPYKVPDKAALQHEGWAGNHDKEAEIQQRMIDRSNKVGLSALAGVYTEERDKHVEAAKAHRLAARLWRGETEPVAPESDVMDRGYPELMLSRFMAAYVSPNTGSGLTAREAVKQAREAPTIPGAKKALGFWSDGAEASYVLGGKDEGELAEKAIALGRQLNQKSVLWFAAGEGPDTAHVLVVPDRDPARVADGLAKHGVEYKTIVPSPAGSIVHVIDQGGALAPNVDAWATEAGAKAHKRYSGTATYKPL